MNRGQSLFEVVVALAISALIIVTLVALVSGSIRNTTFSKNKTLASGFTQEATEWLRGERDKDIVSFKTNIATNIRCLPSLDWTNFGPCGSGDEVVGTPFKREASFSSTSVGGKNIIEADIKVYWADSQGDHEVRSTTNFTDWRER